MERPNSDIAVIGGGIFGLWVARKAIAAGLSVTLVEQSRCGMGASATPLAALMPHLPGRLDAKKRFQLDALTSLPAEIAALESDTGLQTGYRQCGRAIPIRKDTFREKITSALAEMETHWSPDAKQLADWHLSLSRQDPLEYAHESSRKDTQPTLSPIASEFPGWLADDIAPLGVLRDRLSASVDAHRYTDALRAHVADHATLIEQTTFGSWDDQAGCVLDAHGHVIRSASACVIAAGVGSFAALAPDALCRDAASPIGDAVKGHAALLTLPDAINVDPEAPILYDNGIYVVARGQNKIAVGTTTEYRWSTPDASPETARSMISRASLLSPVVAEAQHTEIWAGLRPRAATRNPLVGLMPGRRRLYVATGGYKISFGIAHRIAEALVAQIAGARATSVTIPIEFSTQNLQA